MATIPVPVRRKSAKQELLERFGELIDQAEQTMTVRQFHKASKKSSEAINRALDRRQQRTGTV